jgi:hypothetical protein
MGNKVTIRLAWALWGLMSFLAVVLAATSLWSQAGSKNAFQLALDMWYRLAIPVVFATVAALIVSHQPRNPIGWLLMVPVAMVLLVGPLQDGIERLVPTDPAPTLPILLMVWVSSWSWLLLIFPLLYIPLLFPTGRPHAPRWRWVGVAMMVWAGFFVLITTLVGRMSAGTSRDLEFDNPIGIIGEQIAEPLVGAWVVGLDTLVLLCVAALFLRYRRANDTERKQIKWLLYAGAVFVVVYIVGNVAQVNESTSLSGNIYQVFFALSLVAFPVAIGIAILRYRLYDIDLIINRTLVYSTLTLILGLVYIGCIIVSRTLVAPLTGGSDLAIVASTLVIAALFNPLRRRIQTIIDKRFYRRRYDAAKVLATFGATVRDETDLERLASELVNVVDETMQPEFVGLWLRKPTSDRQRGTS